MQLVVAFISGLLFGAGLGISGMVNPAKVLNFFDIAGTWDPSLAFVMAGALLVTLVGYRLAWKRQAPLYGPKFHSPATNDIDGKLIGGSALFGLGWGLSGFCPGPAIASLTTLSIEPVVFIVAMLAGILATKARQPQTT